MEALAKLIGMLSRRLSEPSTWAGVAAAAAATEAALGNHAGLYTALLTGLVAFLMPEKKG